MTEEWRSVVGHPMYEVSNLGNVRSWKNGRYGSRLTPKPHARSIDKFGYWRVMFTENNKSYQCLLHAVMLTAFVGPRPTTEPDGRWEGAHLDGNPLNCHLSNLQWVTHRENESHKELHGTMSRGERIGTARLTERLVVEIRARLAGGESHGSIARDYGVSRPTITQINLGKRWGHVA